MSEEPLHILLTGATDGIGKEAALIIAGKRLAKTLLLHGRNPEKLAAVAQEIKTKVAAEHQQGQKGTEEETQIHLITADFSSLDSVRAMAKEVIEKYPMINTLINNAGILTKEFGKTKDGFEQMFGVNYVAPTLLTLLLYKPVLEKNQPTRIIHVSSMAHLFYGLGPATQNEEGKWVRSGEQLKHVELDKVSPSEESSFDWYRQYSLSKLGNLLFSQEIERRISESMTIQKKKNFIFTNAVHPGVIETKLKNAGITLPGFPVSEGVVSILHLITSKDGVSKSGEYWNEKGEVAEMNPIGKNQEEVKKFFAASLKWCGLEEGNNGDLYL